MPQHICPPSPLVQRREAGAGRPARHHRSGGVLGALSLALLLHGCGGGGDGDAPANTPPTISGTPPTVALEDASYSFTPGAGDADGDRLTFTIVNAPPWATFDSATGRLSGTPTNDDVDTYPGIVIAVTDGGATASLGEFAIEVQNVNDAPTISGTPETAVDEDAIYAFRATAQDDDAGDTLTFSIENAPPWASFDATTGRLSGVPTNGDVGRYEGIVVSVSDGTATTSLPPFSIDVRNINDAPQIGGTPATATLEDQRYSFTPIVLDVDGDLLTFTISNAPAWATFDTTTGRLSGTPRNEDVGTWEGIDIAVSDGAVAVSLPVFAITVENVNDAPQISGTPSTSVEEDALYTFTPVAEDVDLGDELTFSVANLPSWASFDAASGTLSGTPGDGDGGDYPGIRISVSDGQASTPLARFTITVVGFTELTLTGKVTDAPVANAVINGTIGSGQNAQTFETTADAAGEYSVSLRLREDTTDPQGLVSLLARGVGAQAQIELRAVPGSLAQLIAAAGPDEQLADSAYPRLNVTQVSTARELLSVDFNAGLPPADAGALAAAERAIPPNVLVELAALIRLIVEEDLIPLPEGVSSRDILLPQEVGQTQREAIDALLIGQGLADAQGNFTAAFADALAAAQDATLADADVAAGFDADTVTGVAVWSAATAPGQVLRDRSAKNVVELSADGSGTLWQQVEEPLNFRGRKIRNQHIALQWTLQGSRLSLVFDEAHALANAATVEVAVADLQVLADDLGFPQAVVDYIVDAIANGATVEDPVQVREVRVRRTAQALSSVDRDVQAIVEDEVRRDLDELLTALAWPDPLPSVEASSMQALVIRRPPSTMTPLGEDIVATQTWGLPIQYDLGASGETAPGISADLFSLGADGTTGAGTLSGQSFAWAVSDGDLLLTRVDDSNPPETVVTEYRYARLAEAAGVSEVLVTVQVDGVVTARFTDWVARALPSRETWIPVLTQQAAPAFWLPVTGEPSVGGPRGDRSASYRADGLLDPQFVSGWIFRSDLSAVLFEAQDPSCLADDTLGCFSETGQWTWSAAEDLSRLSLTGDLPLFDREVEWVVLQYDADTDTAIVLEFEESITLDPDTAEPLSETRAPPRINRLDRATLAAYPDELADAQAQGFLQN